MTAIVAMALNRVIGSGGEIPWRLPEDLKFFKRTTLGGVIVMGRKTFDSIGRPLPGRENVVISRSMREMEGVRVVASPEAVEEPMDGRRVFVIGGGEIYRAMLPRCGEILLTLVKREAEGDAWFPEFEREFALAEVLEEWPEFEIRRYVRLGVG